MHGIDYAPPYLPGSAATGLGLVRVVYIYIHIGSTILIILRAR